MTIPPLSGPPRCPIHGDAPWNALTGRCVRCEAEREERRRQALRRYASPEARTLLEDMDAASAERRMRALASPAKRVSFT